MPQQPRAVPAMGPAVTDRASGPDAEYNVDPRLGAILARDRTFDGAFVFGVTSTMIYCRPSCPARHARVDRIRFFDDPASARSAGFRACKRCLPDTAQVAAPTIHAVLRAMDFLDRAGRAPVSLERLAESVSLSKAHLQRAFTRIVGCSPHAWQRHRRTERMRAALAHGDSVSDAAYTAGFESLPRAYAAIAQESALTPGLLRRGAAGVTVTYAVTPCALGHLLVAMTPRGICRVILGDSASALVEQLEHEFHSATLVTDAAVRDVAAQVAAAANGAAIRQVLPLDLAGTAFQQRVWKALTEIPRGETVSYGELATRIGAPNAVRAVGTACGANPAAVIVPCHRVVRGDGAMAGYRWGVQRKVQLLALERQPADGTAGERATPAQGASPPHDD